MAHIELKPTDNRKSFYGKAYIVREGDNIELVSYSTTVARINGKGQFERLWGGYSATTMRHVNAFLDTFGIPGGGKAWWDAQEVKS